MFPRISYLRGQILLIPSWTNAPIRMLYCIHDVFKITLCTLEQISHYGVPPPLATRPGGGETANPINRSFSNIVIVVSYMLFDRAEPRSRRPDAREPVLVDRMQLCSANPLDGVEEGRTLCLVRGRLRRLEAR